MDLTPVEGNKNLYRDNKSNAVINTSDTDYNKYLELKESKLKEIERINKMDEKVNEIDEIKNELGELKSLIKDLVSHSQSNS